jgi:hypothetical protein
MNFNNNKRPNNFQRNNNQNQNYNYNYNNYNQGYYNQNNGNYQHYNQRYNHNNNYNNYNNNNNYDKNPNGYNNNSYNNNYGNSGNNNGNGAYNLPNLMSIKPSGAKFAEDTNGQNKTRQKQELSELEKFEMENQQFNKRHLLAKHQQVQPEKEHINIIEYLVVAIETSLKAVSDQLLADELEKVNSATKLAQEVEAQVATIKTEISEAAESETSAQVEEKPAAPVAQPTPVVDKEKHRHLKGVFRVGPIEKGVFLKFDREIQLIGLTSKLPSYKLVRRIVDELEASEELFAPEKPAKDEAAGQEEVTQPTETLAEKPTNNSRQAIRKRQPPANFDRSKLKLDRSDNLLRENASVSIFYEFSPDVVYEFRIAFSSMDISKKTDLTALNAELAGKFFLLV